MIGRSDDQWNGLKARTREKLLHYIDNMDLDKSHKLPSEYQLCKLFNISRATVREVLEEMLMEGRILRSHGSGSFVNPEFHRIKANLYPHIPLQAIIQNNGYKARSKNLGAQLHQVSPKVAAALKMELDSTVVISTHLFYADTQLWFVCKDYFAYHLIEQEDLIRLNTETSIFYKLLFERTGRITMWDLTELSATDTVRTPELQNYIEDGTTSAIPFLLMELTDYDINAKPLLYSEIYCNTAYFKFGMIRKTRIDFQDYQSEPMTYGRPT